MRQRTKQRVRLTCTGLPRPPFLRAAATLAATDCFGSSLPAALLSLAFLPVGSFLAGPPEAVSLPASSRSVSMNRSFSSPVGGDATRSFGDDSSAYLPTAPGVDTGGASSSLKYSSTSSGCDAVNASESGANVRFSKRTDRTVGELMTTEPKSRKLLPDGVRMRYR